MKDFTFKIAGVSSRIGQVLTAQEWADKMRIPHRKHKGDYLTGAEVTKILGVEKKSWDPLLFQDRDVLVDTAKTALESAGMSADEIEAFVVVTCTPYEVMLDQDAFWLARAIGIADDALTVQAGAGCAGMARAANLIARLNTDRVLMLTYNLPSLIVCPNHEPNKLYQSNDKHPMGSILWASPGLFSDGVAACVMTRCAQEDSGVYLYSRDSHSFGKAEGCTDPLIHYLGGGGVHPPGTPGAEELACYGMAGEEVKAYYHKGMMLNHTAMLRAKPTMLNSVKKFYTHQASPGLVDAFIHSAELPKEKVSVSVRELGNLVTPCTLQMLDEDIQAGVVGSGDPICISVVGAGPERGALITTLA